MFEKIYNLSPVLMQDVMVSAYGLLIRKNRYGHIYQQKFPMLLKNYEATSEDLINYQNKQLSNVIAYAKQFVPYYRGQYRSIGDGEINVMNLAERVPVLEKDVLISGPDRFVSEDPALGAMSVINTSGTSGTPLKVYINKEALQTNYAFFSRTLRIAGVVNGQSSATFAGRIIIPPSQKGAPFWRRNYFMNNTLFSSYHISDRTIPDYIGQMEKLGLVYIDSYPSAIYEIAHYINRNNISHSISPKAIITSSETLLPQQCQEIESAFNTKVYDHYGCAEMAALITQCAHGGYHVNPDFGYVEILDEHNNSVGEGETGQLVCTGFVNKCMPLIRYKIGDAAVFTKKTCSCGCEFPIIGSIEGRVDDMITTPDGSKIGRLDPVYKGLKHIKESQIIQTGINTVTVKIVREKEFDNAMAELLVGNLGQRIGCEFAIKIEYVDRIPRTRSGKFKSVVSNL